MMRLRSLLVGLVALAAVGCGNSSFFDEPTVGELGEAKFAWDEGALGCLFGCDAEEAMAVGAIANLVVLNDEELPIFLVSSTDASVIAFSQSSRGSGIIEAVAWKEGRAKVILSEEGTGDVVDRLAVDAFDVASIEPRLSDTYETRYTIMVGGEAQITFTLRNAAGKKLVGIGAVEYSFEGGVGSQTLDLVDAMTDYILSFLTGTVTEYVGITANEVGSGTILVTAASGASLAIPVDVVDESAVTSITLAAQFDPNDRRSVQVEADVRAGIEPVHAAACIWSITPVEAPVEIDWEGNDSIELIASAPTDVTLTCEIGAAAGAIDLTFK